MPHSAQQLFQQADERHRRGDLQGAEPLYRRVLETQPDHVEALHRLGILAYQQGRHADALSSIGAALTVKPDNAAALADFGLVQASLGDVAAALTTYDLALAVDRQSTDAHSRRGDALRKLGRAEAAVASYEAALSLNRRLPLALNNLGLALMDLGRAQAALASYDAALDLNPDDVLALCNRGRPLQALGRSDEALASYDQALALKPDHLEALNNRGVLLQAFRRSDEALASFDAALAVLPGFSLALNNRGDLLRDLGRLDEALASYDRALAADPRFAEAHTGRGLVLAMRDRPREALASYDQALAIDPASARAHNLRGLALLSLNRPDEALASYDAALALEPDFADALGNKGQLLAELGRGAEARTNIERAIALAPRSVRAYYNLTLAKRMSADDPRFQAMRDMAQDMAAFSADDQIHLHYALAKAYADQGDDEQSFSCLLAGAALKRRETAYDEAATLAGFDHLRAMFSPQMLHDQAGPGDPSAEPVFIVGMPRSGTTLIEQILASHPQVHAAGESDAFARAFEALGGDAEASGLAPAQFLRRLGETYRQALGPAQPGATRITNKTPDNFRYVGLIRLALPNARIIHTGRDPIDTCLSCFSKLFGGDLPYTYDLAELGRYYRAYEGLMAHWRSVVPPDVMLDVRYEDVVGDLEGQARRIVAHCGLEWDPRCLDFHLTDRWVRTASSAQVRQPIFQTSVGRWRPPDALLAPLIAGLGRGGG